MQIDFLGGLDASFGAKTLQIDTIPTNIGNLVKQLSKKIISNPQFFTQEDELRKGILVLINERDWQLLDGVSTELFVGDKVTFISTLHGG